VGRASLFRRVTDTNVYGTGSVKIMYSPQNIRRYRDIFAVHGEHYQSQLSQMNPRDALRHARRVVHESSEN